MKDKKPKSPHCCIRLGLNEYGKIHSLKEPDLSTLKDQDQLRLLKWQHGVRCFPPKLTHVPEYNDPATTEAEIQKNPPFLWVALRDRIKIVNEMARAVKRLSGDAIKHTNLTGGKKAYSGGELWFTGERCVTINGASGRYGPRTEAELAGIVKVFCESGWCVTSLGWDDVVKRPAKFAR